MTERSLENGLPEIDRLDVPLRGRGRDRPRSDGPAARESEWTLDAGGTET